MLDSLQYSWVMCLSTGDVLNCNIYDVATHAAVELKADKLIIMR